MRIKQIVSLIGFALLALSPATWAAGGRGGGGGGGGFGGGGGGFGGGGGHAAGGGGPRGGGAGLRSAGPRVGGSPYYYSRGRHFAQRGNGQVRSPSRQSPSVARPNRGVNDSAGRSARRAEFNQRIGSRIAERHASNWRGDWDHRHSHFDHGRFFVFIDGFWCGLDGGVFPWDYYPYYAYDYYPYDYYPGYYADTEPYYYNEGVYSNTPVVDPTVTAVQTSLTKQGYYGGPVDGIYGPTTRDAVAKFQIAKRLDVSGNLSAQTLQSLGVPEPAAS